MVRIAQRLRPGFADLRTTTRTECKVHRHTRDAFGKSRHGPLPFPVHDGSVDRLRFAGTELFRLAIAQRTFPESEILHCAVSEITVEFRGTQTDVKRVPLRVGTRVPVLRTIRFAIHKERDLALFGAHHGHVRLAIGEFTRFAGHYAEPADIIE